VPRLGGLRAWGLAEPDFQRRLAIQDRARITDPGIEGQSRRGRDFLRVTIKMTVTAADVGQALVIAWRAFRRAAGEDLDGWDLATVSAEVWPEQR
jgi:hypothetical protein